MKLFNLLVRFLQHVVYISQALFVCGNLRRADMTGKVSITYKNKNKLVVCINLKSSGVNDSSATERKVSFGTLVEHCHVFSRLEVN